MTVKLISLIKRKPGFSRDEFIDYYETTHVHLGLEHTRMSAYRRNFVMGEGALVPGDDTALGFDVITESVFPDRDALGWSWRHCATPEIRRLFDIDEAKFIDTARTVIFQVEERTSRIGSRRESNRSIVERLAAAIVANDRAVMALLTPDLGARGTLMAMRQSLERDGVSLILKEIIGDADADRFAVLFEGNTGATGDARRRDILELWQVADGWVRSMTGYSRNCETEP